MECTLQRKNAEFVLKCLLWLQRECWISVHSAKWKKVQPNMLFAKLVSRNPEDKFLLQNEQKISFNKFQYIKCFPTAS